MSTPKESIVTRYGELMPQYTSDDLRKRDIQPVVYHECGTIKSIPLENQTIITTPIGDIPAELVTFHENGSLNRIFPLNGRLSGYWSQEDEAGLATPVQLNTPVGPIKTTIISAGFYETGTLRSLTVWPGESINVETPAGIIETRIGISFTEGGSIRSVEPAKPIPVVTPAGEVQAFDPDAVGVNGDCNSLMFGADGSVVSITTTLTRLTAVHENGTTTVYTPETRESLCGNSETEIVPMVIGFDPVFISIQQNPDKQPVTVPVQGHVFFTEPYLPQLANMFTELPCSI